MDRGGEEDGAEAGSENGQASGETEKSVHHRGTESTEKARRNIEEKRMKKGDLLKKYYLSLRVLHPKMRAVRAAEQARIWIRCGHFDVPFYRYEPVYAGRGRKRCRIDWRQIEVVV